MTTRTVRNRAKLLSENVHEIRYTHVDDKLDYFHPFGRRVEMWVNPDGSVTLRHKDGEPLWNYFDV